MSDSVFFSGFFFCLFAFQGFFSLSFFLFIWLVFCFT